MPHPGRLDSATEGDLYPLLAQEHLPPDAGQEKGPDDKGCHQRDLPAESHITEYRDPEPPSQYQVSEQPKADIKL